MSYSDFDYLTAEKEMTALRSQISALTEERDKLIESEREKNRLSDLANIASKYQAEKELRKIVEAENLLLRGR